MTSDGHVGDDLDAQEHPALQTLSRSVSPGEAAKQGAAWLGGSRAVRQIVQFAFSILTARLLLPSDFGVAALALAIVMFAALFTDLGLAAAIVHARRATTELLNTAFWLNTGTGLVLAVLVAGLAWPISQIYGNDEVFLLLLVASLNFAVTRGAVQTALLERTFNYRRLAIIETVAAAVGLIVVPVAALSGAGAMSLVLGPLVETTLLTTGLWLSVPWRPTGRPTRAAVSALWAYSKGLVGFNVLAFWSRNLDTLLLGAAVPAAQLGQYNRAFNLMTVPVQQMSLVLGRVLFPSLARLQDDRRRLGAAWIRALEASAAASMPIAVTFAATAPALVAVLYGPRWMGMVDVLELLSLSAVPALLAGSTGGLYRAIGKTGVLFRVGCVTTALTAVAIVVGLPHGIEGVAACLLVNAWIGLPITAGPVVRFLEIPARDLVLPFVRLVTPVAIMAAAELAVRWSVPAGTPVGITLVAQLTAGGLAYIGALWATGSPLLAAVRSRFSSMRTDRLARARS